MGKWAALGAMDGNALAQQLQTAVQTPSERRCHRAGSPRQARNPDLHDRGGQTTQASVGGEQVGVRTGKSSQPSKQGNPSSLTAWMDGKSVLGGYHRRRERAIPHLLQGLESASQSGQSNGDRQGLGGRRGAQELTRS